MHARGSGGARLLPGLRVRWRGTRRRGSCRIRASGRRSSCASRRSPARAARPTWRATCAASPSSSTPRRESSISSATTSRSSSSRTRSSFPDLIHAVKPEPHNEMPQAASAHDTFWDFISLMPESMHMIMWVMSDRAIPRSFRMMEGFGVHTFRFINDRGRVALRQVPLEAAARRALGGLGRGAEDLRARTPTSIGATSGKRSRTGTSRSGSSACRSSRRRTSTSSTSTCSIRRRSFPEELVPVRAHRPADARIATPTTSSPRPSRSPSTPATSCPESTSRTTRCSRAGSSPTPTRS